MRIELDGFYVRSNGTGLSFDLNKSSYMPLAAAFTSPWEEMVVSATNPVGTTTVPVLNPFDTNHDGSWDSNLQGSFVIEKTGTVMLWNGNYTGTLTHVIKAEQSTITKIEPWVSAGMNEIIKVYWDGGAVVSSVVGKTLATLTVDGTEIVATHGSDIITTTSASEKIRLGAGNDVVNAGAGDDIIFGDVGADVMTGGLGADTFAYALYIDSGKTASTRDRITDFEVGIDTIDLTLIDANLRKDGDQGFKFRGDDGFSKKATGPQITFKQTFDGDEEITLISGRLAGNKKADFTIELDGHIDLTASDFLL